MSLMDTFQIGKSALSAAGTQIATTAHNVANAGVEGYSRRTVDVTAATPISSRGLNLGAGVSISGIGRATDALR